MSNGNPQNGAELKRANPTGYAQAKLAALFHGVLKADDTSSVTYRYETPAQRRAKREAKETDAKAAEERRANELPPGVERSPDGIGFAVVDQKAFDAWQREKSDLADARKTIAEAEERAAA